MSDRIHLGAFGARSATATRFAELAIEAAALRGRSTMLVMLDLSTGDVWLDSTDALVPKGVFARGVRFDSDPDLLADDLREEAHEAGLIEARDKKLSRRPARRAA